MVRVSATGTKTFALAYHSKADQKTRFLTFGQYGDITLADAFARHAKARAALANGDDPQAAKVEQRALKKSALTFDETDRRILREALEPASARPATASAACAVSRAPSAGATATPPASPMTRRTTA